MAKKTNTNDKENLTPMREGSLTEMKREEGGER